MGFKLIPCFSRVSKEANVLIKYLLINYFCQLVVMCQLCFKELKCNRKIFSCQCFLLIHNQLALKGGKCMYRMSSCHLFLLITTHLCIQDSIISHAISLSLWLRCCPNSRSGQWRSRMKACRASSFQNRSSEVPQPLLENKLVIRLLVGHIVLVHGLLHDICSSGNV